MTVSVDRCNDEVVFSLRQVIRQAKASIATDRRIGRSAKDGHGRWSRCRASDSDFAAGRDSQIGWVGERQSQFIGGWGEDRAVLGDERFGLKDPVAGPNGKGKKNS